MFFHPSKPKTWKALNMSINESNYNNGEVISFEVILERDNIKKKKPITITNVKT